MLERLRGQFAIALWDERRRELISGEIALASRHFSGAGRATGCSLPRRSKDCSPQEWFRRGRTGADSTRSSLFRPCRGRGHVLKECNFCRPVIASISRGAGGSPVITERAYWEMDFPAGRGSVGRRSAEVGRRI